MFYLYTLYQKKGGGGHLIGLMGVQIGIGFIVWYMVVMISLLKL